MNPSLREQIARIVYAATWPNNDPAVPWALIENVMAKEPILAAADEIATLLAQAVSQEDMVVVPRESTERFEIEIAAALSMADPDERGLPEGETMRSFYGMLARVAYRAMVAAAPPAVQGVERWLPIESAPRDGIEVLLRRGDRVSSGAWIEGDGGTTEHRDLDGRWIGQDDREPYAAWLSWDGGFLAEDPPTHWMPLPEPPQ